MIPQNAKKSAAPERQAQQVRLGRFPHHFALVPALSNPLVGENPELFCGYECGDTA
jgi:hypothetical protein